MKVRCRTNLDDYKREVWPEEFCCRPIVGDAVQSKNGLRLWITAITHTMYDPIEYNFHSAHPKLIPILIIELHKREAV